MFDHPFLFNPGTWVGQGRLSFSTSPTQLRFYTKWVINEKKEDAIQAEQWIEQQGEQDLMGNVFTISAIKPASFEIELSNELIGSVKGQGIIDTQTIAWEFKLSMNPDREDGFEGFEVYELQDNGDYLFHAEYFSGVQYRTTVDGRIWKKTVSN